MLLEKTEEVSWSSGGGQSFVLDGSSGGVYASNVVTCRPAFSGALKSYCFTNVGREAYEPFLGKVVTYEIVVVSGPMLLSSWSCAVWIWCVLADDRSCPPSLALTMILPLLKIVSSQHAAAIR
jgi:hypothetical protein